MLVLYGFTALAGIVCGVMIRILPRGSLIRLMKLCTGDRTASCMRKIYPGEDPLEGSLKSFRKKVSAAAFAAGAGALLALGYELTAGTGHELLEENRIERPDYGKGDKKVRLKVSEEVAGQGDVIGITVSERRYDHESLEAMAERAKDELIRIAAGDNGSLDHISTDMVLPERLEGYPFRISWRTDDPLLIDSHGVINRTRYEDDIGVFNEGILTGIHAELKYEDYTGEVEFSARIFPVSAKEVTLPEYVSELIVKEDKETSEDKSLKLPGYVEGRRVIYEEVSDGKSLIILMLVLLSAVLIYFREDSELGSRVKERDAELIRDYPGLINRFALYYCAGLTTRGIWSKLCRDYRESLNRGGGRRYLYEEMLLCEGRMNEGTGELTAYEAFASACGLHIYRQFISLISQAVSIGRQDMMHRLEDEANEAFERRRRRAMELGGEAGTKLLLPMFMMLFVVLALVTVPAFMSIR
ncbi:MAG: hypothetical protein K6F34_09475 [Lachnospiraceae bacterium]|nr:hypothetical protein [Lachnospiraceae bacterium]